MHNSKGMAIATPAGYSALEWVMAVQGGHFEKHPEATTPYLTLQNKPAWLLGSAKGPHMLLATWLSDPCWLDSELVDMQSPGFFRSGLDIWSPQQKLLIDFIAANNIAIAFWVYFK